MNKPEKLNQEICRVEQLIEHNDKLFKQKIDALLKEHKVIQQELKIRVDEIKKQHLLVINSNEVLEFLGPTLERSEKTLYRKNKKPLPVNNVEVKSLLETRSLPNYASQLDLRSNENVADPETVRESYLKYPKNFYEVLMKGNRGPYYKATRTRVAICLMTVLGIPITHLLKLKTGHLYHLLNDQGMLVLSNTLKKYPSYHKALLTATGKAIIDARKRDFSILLEGKTSYCYIFTSAQKPEQQLRRETITTDINQALNSASDILPDKPKITSSNFRKAYSYISEIWEDTEDIKCIKSTIRENRLPIIT